MADLLRRLSAEAQKYATAGPPHIRDLLLEAEGEIVRLRNEMQSLRERAERGVLEMRIGYAEELRSLVSGLAEAALADELSEGQDIAAGMLGPETSEWLRRIAERLSGEPRRPTSIDPRPPLSSGDMEPK